MSRLTIIIPLLRCTPLEAFEETLASVLTFRPHDAEIRIANEVDYPDPWNVRKEGVVFLPANGLRGFVQVLNSTIEAANGQFINILYPGTDVSADWSFSSSALFENETTAVVVPTVFDRQKPKRIFAKGVMFSNGGTLRTIRRLSPIQIWPDSVAPHISAAFFRKSALMEISGFQDSFEPQLAFVDAAFLLHELGWKSVVDHQSRILVRPNALPAISPYLWAKQLERLYFRWMGRQTSFGAVGTHLGAVAVDFWRHFPRFRAFQLLTGRLVGMTNLFERNALEQLLQNIRDNESSPDSQPLSISSTVKVA